MVTIDCLGCNKKSTITRVKKEFFITKFYNNKKIIDRVRKSRHSFFLTTLVILVGFFTLVCV
jgi:hypothetical protein